MNDTNRTTWLSWSSGKDSYAALAALTRATDVQVERLFTVIDGGREQVPMHAVSVDLLERQAQALGQGLRPVFLDGASPERAFLDLLNEARASGATQFAFGDLFLEDVRQHRERNMAGHGIDLLFPLWSSPTEALVRGLVADGMRAVITSVDLRRLPASFLGRELTGGLVDELLARGCDPCGEYGEFHSFVFDGPLFAEPVRFVRQAPRVGTDYAHLPLGSG